jgi:hypothetical protein
MPLTKTRASAAALALLLAIPLAAAAQDRSTAPASSLPSAPTGSRGPVGAPQPPIVAFTHSNAGWSANFSFADPVTEIQWSLSPDGPFESTGFLQLYDPQTRRPMADPSIEIEADAGTIYVRYADLQGNWVGPFAIAFRPETELQRSYRSILETTSGAWLAFRHDVPNILYYTHLSSYRCTIRELRIGLDKLTPDQAVPLAPCNMKNPAATPADVDTHLWIDPAVRFATAQIIYTDGTVSKVRIVRRSDRN